MRSRYERDIQHATPPCDMAPTASRRDLHCLAVSGRSEKSLFVVATDHTCRYAAGLDPGRPAQYSTLSSLISLLGSNINRIIAADDGISMQSEIAYLVPCAREICTCKVNGATLLTPQCNYGQPNVCASSTRRLVRACRRPNDVQVQACSSSIVLYMYSSKHMVMVL
jgi:hypothetical protein